MKRLFITSLALIAMCNLAIGQLTQITSTGDGDWEDTGSWDLGRVPTENDLIRIQAGETITVTTNNSTCNETPATHLFIEGTLTFTIGGKLKLGCGSTITVESGGLIDGGSGGGNSKKIYICDNEEWNSGDPDVVGPFMFGDPKPTGDEGLSADIDILDAFSLVDPPDPSDDESLTSNPGEAKMLWLVGSGDHLESYDILRSENGWSYDVIEHIEVNELISEPTGFEFIDEDPIEGTSYYKLRKTTMDGEVQESKARVWNNFRATEGTCVLTVYPNPCPGNCRAKLSDCPQDTPELRLMLQDATGHIVNESYATRNYDGSFDVQIDKTNNLKPGIYIFSAVSGEDKFSEKVIIK